MKRSNKGYSLVELLIVIAIMAILSGVAVVSVGLIKQARARDADQLESGYGNDKGTDGSGQWYIKFDKATGAVLKGAGKYVFTDTKGDLVSTVYLDAATGNHYIK